MIQPCPEYLINGQLQKVVRCSVKSLEVLNSGQPCLTKFTGPRPVGECSIGLLSDFDRMRALLN